MPDFDLPNAGGGGLVSGGAHTCAGIGLNHDAHFGMCRKAPGDEFLVRGGIVSERWRRRCRFEDKMMLEEKILLHDIAVAGLRPVWSRGGFRTVGDERTGHLAEWSPPS